MRKSQQWVKNKIAKKEKAKSHAFIRFLYVFLLMCFFIALIYTFLFSDVIRVAHIEINGNSDLTEEELTGEVQSVISGKYFNYLNKDNYLFVRKKAIRRRLNNEFKKIESIKIEKVFPDKMIITVSEREALIVWCSAGPCYLIDENGYAYMGTDLDSKFIIENQLIQIVDKSGRPVDLGDKIWESENIEYIRKVKSIFGEAGINLYNQFKVLTRVADTFNVMTDQGWILKLNSQYDSMQTAMSLRLFLESFEQLESIDDLEYIDLRIKNKIFYKLKQKEEEVVESEEVIDDEQNQEVNNQIDEVQEEEEEKTDDKKKKNKDN